MNNGVQFVKESIPDHRAASELMSRLYEVARPDNVFSNPVVQGDYAVITASEVLVGIGYGHGGGGSSEQEKDDGEDSEQAVGYYSGGGGGGTAAGRPVAAIEIGPHGVRVQPIVDPTKIMLALFTALGAMFMMFDRMRKLAGG